jgi:hypothetical protein
MDPAIKSKSQAGTKVTPDSKIVDDLILLSKKRCVGGVKEELSDDENAA